MVLAQVKEVEDVSVPRLDVHSERAHPLAAALEQSTADICLERGTRTVVMCAKNPRLFCAFGFRAAVFCPCKEKGWLWEFVAPHLVDEPCGLVVDAQHGHDAVGGAVRPGDVGAARADVVQRQPDACRRRKTRGGKGGQSSGQREGEHRQTAGQV